MSELGSLNSLREAFVGIAATPSGAKVHDGVIDTLCGPRVPTLLST